MGNYFPVRNVLRRKRTSSGAGLNGDGSCEDLQSSPKRRKLKSTTEYIYETLFVNGQSSDVTIAALGKEWHLHKVYLCQSDYFQSMFHGSWKEASMNYIAIEVPDENVTIEALDVALGSLYRDEVLIDSSFVINLLAAASLLSLKDLMQQCADVMLENVSLNTASWYFAASGVYGLMPVSKACVQCLQRTLMPNVTVELLQNIDAELMSNLIESSDLFVIQVEMDVYSMLRKWLFLQLIPTWDNEGEGLTQQAEAFIRSQVASQNWSPSFLESPQGRPYISVFSKIRLQHIIIDHSSILVLENDHIFPRSWLHRCYRHQWLNMLQLNSGLDLGPESCDPETFEKRSMRCGRTLDAEGQYCWRWTGFNFGVDILISCINRQFFLKRNCNRSNCHGAIAPQAQRHLVYRLTVAASFAKENHPPYVKTTGIQQLSLKTDEEVAVLTVERNITYPLHVSCNFLLYTPNPTNHGQQEGPVSLQPQVLPPISN